MKKTIILFLLALTLMVQQGWSKGGFQNPQQGWSKGGFQNPQQGWSKGGFQNPQQGWSKGGFQNPQQGWSKGGFQNPQQGWSKGGFQNPQQGWSKGGFQNPQQGLGIYTAISILPAQDLSETEKEGLLKMRQEEKLARDVYLKLYEKWGLQIFANIANSEQKHMYAVTMLLEKYGIEDSITDDTIGIFENTEFADLFNEFVTTGEASVIDALYVGAKIEDLDIADLKNLLENTDNDDIKFVYERLRNGSYHHLRVFSRILESYGDTYTPEYISADEYSEILSQTTGGYGKGFKGQGNGKGQCIYSQIPTTQ